ncbi:hypothetical protein [Shimazuella alba]|uniref:Uncharacterized protein n=1 Tax=Shimazuella alba TaxID=2690964 RepID=A0A6I4VXP6_9BACL|nr:hypothetical protein [Shimazuella alba]MXQ52822.1 hypothetical protein [Shimazuella alba]
MSVDETRQRLDKKMADCKAEAAELIPNVEEYLRRRRDGLPPWDVGNLEYALTQLHQFHDFLAVPGLSHEHVLERVSWFNGRKAAYARLMK